MSSGISEDNIESRNNFIETPSDKAIMRIELMKSKSKRLQSIVNRISQLPNYEYNEFDNKHSFEIHKIKDYVMHYSEIEEIISIVSKWKSAVIILEGKVYSNTWDYSEFQDSIMTQSGGSYEIVINSYTKCAINSVTFEDLPLPLVYYPSHYGTFFGFSEDVDKKIYFCQCQREAIENYIKLRQARLLDNFTGIRAAPIGDDSFSKHIAKISLKDKHDPLSLFGFKENLCFKCNNKIPKIKYCHPMYGTLFKQRYGWYVNQKFYELGIDRYNITNNELTIRKCPPHLYDDIEHYYRLHYQSLDKDYNPEKNKELEMYRRGIVNSVENIARVELGFPKIGEHWTSEVVLFNIVEGLYPDHETKRHYRPKWLEGLELDIYIPELKLAFEYQGIQHYKAVDHWGGEEQLEKQQNNGIRKKELCKRHGVDLIIVNYDEEISTDYLKKKVLSLVGK